MDRNHLQEILVEDGRAVGVLTAKGHEVRASSVICHFDQNQLDDEKKWPVKTMCCFFVVLFGAIRKLPIC